jgi:hypothetical protein
MKGEYVDNKLQDKMPKNSNFCVQNHLSDRTCLINTMLTRHDNPTIEASFHDFRPNHVPSAPTHIKFQCCNKSTTFNITLARKCLLVPTKKTLLTCKYFMFLLLSISCLKNTQFYKDESFYPSKS